jgi:uncharacterized OsmC-like protein
MVKFPINFDVTASASSGTQTTWKSQSPHLPPISVAIPPEFMGPGGGYSPEDLFALSVVNCMIALFKVYVEKGGLRFQQVEAKARLTADRPSGGSSFVMTHLDCSFVVSGASDPVKVRKALEKATQDCPIGNSIKTGKTFHIEVSA